MIADREKKVVYFIPITIQNKKGWTAFEYVKKMLEHKRFPSRRYRLNQNKVLIKYAKQCIAKQMSGLTYSEERS